MQENDMDTPEKAEADLKESALALVNEVKTELAAYRKPFEKGR